MNPGNEKITQEVFDRLPWLLKPADFMRITGLSEKELAAMRRDKEIAAYCRPGGKYHKYYKRDAARIAGFKL